LKTKILIYFLINSQIAWAASVNKIDYIHQRRDRFVIIAVLSTSCGACHKQIEELRAFQEITNCRITTVNNDAKRDLMARHNLIYVPSLIALDPVTNEEIVLHQGYLEASRLIEKVYLYLMYFR
jgi:hypothetical protein